MKKWNKYYMSITMIMMILTYIISIIFSFNTNNFSDKERKIIVNILLLMVILILLAMLIFFVIHMFICMKRGVHNIKECDDELFQKIDQYKKCWGEDKYSYIKQLQIINLYYKKNGKVDELVKHKEIKRLYARADFLLTQVSFSDNFITCFYSLVISVIASFVCQMMQCDSVLPMLILLIVIVLSFLGILLSRYAKKGQAGSYTYYIDNYERDLLLQKIQKLESQLTIKSDDEQTLETKQIVINELIKIRQKNHSKKQKEIIENEINQVSRLDLCISNYNKVHIQKIYINGFTCCLVYDNKKGKGNNYTGKSNLINQEYAILYEILNKYQLISYYEDDAL